MFDTLSTEKLARRWSWRHGVRRRGGGRKGTFQWSRQWTETCYSCTILLKDEIQDSCYTYRTVIVFFVSRYCCCNCLVLRVFCITGQSFSWLIFLLPPGLTTPISQPQSKPFPRSPAWLQRSWPNSKTQSVTGTQVLLIDNHTVKIDSGLSGQTLLAL